MTRRLFALALLLTGSAVAVSASTPITCGATIGHPGRYFLAASCACPGNGPCIKVRSNDVTISLNNQTLACAPTNPEPADNDTTVGVQATSVHDFALIGCDAVGGCTGKVTGCYAGIKATSDRGLIIDRVNLSGSTFVAVDATDSTRVRISNNTIDRVAGYLGPGKHNGYAIGVNGCGAGCEVIANVFRNIVTQARAIPPLAGEGASVIVRAKTGVIIAYNWFESVAEGSADIGVKTEKDAAAAVRHNTFTGLWHAVSGPGRVTVTNNRIMLKNPEAWPNSIGILGGSGLATRNMIINYKTAIDAKVKDDGTNFVAAAPVTATIARPQR